MIVVFTRFNAG